MDLLSQLLGWRSHHHSGTLGHSPMLPNTHLGKTAEIFPFGMISSALNAVENLSSLETNGLCETEKEGRIHCPELGMDKRPQNSIVCSCTGSMSDHSLSSKIYNKSQVLFRLER